MTRLKVAVRSVIYDTNKRNYIEHQATPEFTATTSTTRCAATRFQIRFIQTRATRLSIELPPINIQKLDVFLTLLENYVKPFKFPGVWVKDALLLAGSH